MVCGGGEPLLVSRDAERWHARRRVTEDGPPELLAALTIRYPTVPIHFAETRPLAEEW